MTSTARSLDLPINEIVVSDRLRDVDPDWVAVLSQSISERGLQQPVIVRPREDGRYDLVAGAHRIAAMRTMGLPTVPAEVREVDDLEARLTEIDENLFRHELKPLDRAAFLAERQRIYQQMYPETAQGTAGAKAKQGATLMFSFADATAKATGLGRSTVQRAVAIYRRLDPDIRRRLAGTKVGQKEGELYALSQHDPDTQSRIVAALTREDQPATSVKAAAAEVTGQGAAPNEADAQFQKLVQAYRRAPASVQARFRDWLSETQEESARAA